MDLLAERVVQLGGTVEGTLQVVTTRTGLPAYPLTLTEEQEHVEALASVGPARTPARRGHGWRLHVRGGLWGGVCAFLGFAGAPLGPPGGAGGALRGPPPRPPRPPHGWGRGRGGMPHRPWTVTDTDEGPSST